ncbi:hypothetical protein [Roseicyclus sp.]
MVAEDDDLAGILDGAMTAAMDFCDKDIPTNMPLYIARGTANDLAVAPLG